MVRKYGLALPQCSHTKLKREFDSFKNFKLLFGQRAFNAEDTGDV